jgi:HlyD family secretion protein
VLALASWEPVVSVRGKVTKINYDENDDVERGDTLFNTVAYSQTLINSYEQIQEYKERIAELTELLDDTELIAPCDGIVTSVYKSKGDAVAEDEPVVAITLTDTWVLTVSVDELDINQIEVGQQADIVLDSLPDNTYEGQVEDISNSSTSSGGITSYTVRITLAGDSSFKLGMNASAEIIVKQVENALRIPVDAVRTLGDTNYVVVYTERTKEELKAIRESILEGTGATLQSALASAGEETGSQTDRYNILDNILP